MLPMSAEMIIVLLLFALIVLSFLLLYCWASLAKKDDTIGELSKQLSGVFKSLEDLQAESIKFINVNAEYANSINELSNEYMREALRAKFYANLNNPQEKQKDDTAS